MSSKNGKRKAPEEDGSDSSKFEEGSSSSEGSDTSDSDDSSTQKKNTKQAQKAKQRDKGKPLKKAAPTKKPTKKPFESTALELPTFCLEDENGQPLDPKRYELWSIRLPSLLPLTALEGRELAVPTVDAPGQTIAANANEAAHFETDKGESFAFRLGNEVENESFRLLVRSSNEKDSDSDDESDEDSQPTKASLLTTANMTFSRHINVVNHMEEVVATKVAPGADRAPKPDPISALVTSGPFSRLRKAYENRPQKQGLKRRWMPMGSMGGENRLETPVKRERKTIETSAGSTSKNASRKRSSSGRNEITSPVKKERSNSKNSSSKKNRKRSNSEMSTDSTSRKSAPAANGTLVKRKRSSSGASETKKETPVKREPIVKSDDKSPKNGEKLSKTEKKARKAEKKASKKAKKEKKKAKK